MPRCKLGRCNAVTQRGSVCTRCVASGRTHCSQHQTGRRRGTSPRKKGKTNHGNAEEEHISNDDTYQAILRYLHKRFGDDDDEEFNITPSDFLVLVQQSFDAASMAALRRAMLAYPPHRRPSVCLWIMQGKIPEPYPFPLDDTIYVLYGTLPVRPNRTDTIQDLVENDKGWVCGIIIDRNVRRMSAEEWEWLETGEGVILFVRSPGRKSGSVHPPSLLEDSRFFPEGPLPSSTEVVQTYVND